MQKITTGQPLQHPTPWVYIVLHLRNEAFFPDCRVHLDARKNHARNIIQPFRVFMISCNELHATGGFHLGTE